MFGASATISSEIPVINVVASADLCVGRTSVSQVRSPV